MQVIEEKGLKRKIEFTVPLEEVNAGFLKSYQQIQKTARMPGFRQGKVPLKTLERNYKNQAYQKTIESLFHSFYPIALNQLSLRPAGPPQLLNVDLREGQACKFLLEIEIHPQVGLKGLESLHCAPFKSQIKEEDVDSALKRLRESFAEWADTTGEGPLKKADFCDIQLEAFSLSGERKLEPTSLMLEAGKNFIAPGFDKHLIGLKLKEKREFDFLFPEDHPHTKVAGQKLRVSACLIGFKNKVLPNLKSLAEKLSLKTVEELRDKIKKDIQKLENQKYQEKLEQDILQQIIEKNPLDLPEVLIRQEVQRLKDIVKQQWDQKSPGQSSAFLKDKEPEFEKSAKKNLHISYLVQQLIQDMEIKVSEEEIKQSLKKTFPETPLENVKAQLKQEQSWDSWIFNLKKKKALGQLIHRAQNKTLIIP